LWTSTATAWGIYMSQSGATHAMDGGAAPSGTSFSSYAVRFRAGSSNAYGFIFENGSNVELMSIRGGDGLIHSKYIQDHFNRTNLNGSLMLANENGYILGTTNLYRVSSPGAIPFAGESLGILHDYASLKGHQRGDGCTVFYKNSFQIDYNKNSGFSLVRSEGGQSGSNWVFGGTGTVSDPYTAQSPTLINGACGGGIRYLTYTVNSSTGELVVAVNASGGSNGVIDRLIIETY